jgi:hypothetical protein
MTINLVWIGFRCGVIFWLEIVIKFVSYWVQILQCECSTIFFLSQVY